MKSISKDSQRGSAHVIIIAILVFALIGALGFIFWSNFLQPKSDSGSFVKTDASPSPSASAMPKTDDNTIVLSDWKVKLTIPESLKSTSVKYSKETRHGKTDYEFTTSRIEALGGDCATQPYGKSIVLSRVTEIPANAMNGFVRVNQEPINGYYFTYTETIPACSGSITDPTVKVNQVEIDDRAALGALLKSLNPSE